MKWLRKEVLFFGGTAVAWALETTQADTAGTHPVAFGLIGCTSLERCLHGWGVSMETSPQD